MELKINIDTKAIAAHMLMCMVQNLHNSVVTFAHQKFGAINPQAGAMPFPAHVLQGLGQFPGQFFPPMQYGMGGVPFPMQGPGVPAGHPYAQFGAPPPPYAPSSAFARAQQPGGNPNFPIHKSGNSEYGNLMDELAANPQLIEKIEQILTVHLQEFVNQPPAAAKATPQA